MYGIPNQIKLFIKSIEQDKEFRRTLRILQSMKLVKKIYEQKLYCIYSSQVTQKD